MTMSRFTSTPLARALSRLPSSSTRPPSAVDVEAFGRAQRLAFGCAQACAKEMRVGWTEGRTAKWMFDYLHDHGVRSFLHKPIVAFGDRTLAHDDHWGPPNGPGLTLKEGDVVILDCAPVLEGYTGDIAYTLAVGDHPGLDAARDFLSEIRAELPERIMDPATSATIFDWVDKRIRDAGYENGAGGYGEHILGHRVYKHGKFFTRHAGFPPQRFFGHFLSWHGAGFLLNTARHAINPEVLNVNHRGLKTGVWAVEPHLRVDGWGCKFEELLVVQPDRAYWLDDISQERIVIE
ncbi:MULTISPECIES: M24 family metallopeptidase [unclassified Crossiella]|uniref:M24 family metallopeptidase n=1 Tax=unclassified Crossiella TaxID=2620835 RepID=UPI0020001B23|nr:MULTISPECIES: M24 family metallopeptidase [unclassified Crossiella]MCK2243749.1 aminopeptidase P family protein [Crossiella sp. S99.2]MCK2257608.1 aminopeptidase P family protein [Crossiella sp. S99.1]